MMRITVAAVAGMLALAQEPGAFRILGDTALTGQTYRRLEVAGAKVRACESLCEDDDGCAAFTVAPKSGGSGWTCELKTAAGARRLNQAGFTSGVRMAAMAPAPPDAERPVSGDSAVRPAGRQGMPPEIALLIKERFEGRGGGAEIVMRPSDGGAIGAATVAAPGTPGATAVEAPRSEASTFDAGAGAVVGTGAADAKDAGAERQVTTQIPPVLTGEWSVPSAGAPETVAIVQSGDKITFRDSAGRSAEGKLVDRTVTVEAWAAKGALDPFRYELRWSNGSVWTRVKP